MSINNYKQDISSFEIFLFLKKSWKVIFLAMLLGISSSAIYLYLAEDSYRANVDIMLSRYASLDSLDGTKASDPSEVHKRVVDIIKSPNLDICIDKDGSRNIKAGDIKVIPSKFNESAFTLSITMPSKQMASDCIYGIFKALKVQDDEIVKRRIKVADTALAYISNEIKTLGTRFNDAIPDSSTKEVLLYLLAQKQISGLSDEYARIRYFVNRAEFYQMKMLGDIEVNNLSSFRSKIYIVIFGSIIGSFFGLIFAAARNSFRS